jgi:hypothetical protein
LHWRIEAVDVANSITLGRVKGIFRLIDFKLVEVDA